MFLRRFIPSIFISLALFSCSQHSYVEFSGYAQGGVYCVKADLKGVMVPKERIASSIDSLLRDIDYSLSGYNKNSLVSRRNAGEVIVPDRYFREVYELSKYYKELSEGAFDVAAAPLFDIWGFGFTTDSLPSDERIAQALSECREEKKLNFNAIAQGYSCDIVANYLKSIGVKSMLVDIGEIYCEGLNPSGKGWAIGIDRPSDNNRNPGQELSGLWISDGGAHGVVTSGNYRKFYIKDGKKYAHTIDPRNGYPVEHGLLSATIIAPTAAQADALATICMVIGPQKARILVESMPEIEACLICDEGIYDEAIWTSKGWVSEGCRK